MIGQPGWPGVGQTWGVFLRDQTLAKVWEGLKKPIKYAGYCTSTPSSEKCCCQPWGGQICDENMLQNNMQWVQNEIIWK